MKKSLYFYLIEENPNHPVFINKAIILDDSSRPRSKTRNETLSHKTIGVHNNK